MAKIDVPTLVITYLSAHPDVSSKDIHEGLSAEVGYATVKRAITKLTEDGTILQAGQRKSTKYRLSPAYELLRPVDIGEYFQNEIDQRIIKKSFNDQLIPLLRTATIFTNGELNHLHELQEKFLTNISTLSDAAYGKEMERLAIDLSWKSSQIEGNTYSLLETELLLKEQQAATGKTKEEATMLLNHKAALDLIVEQPTYLSPLSVARIEDIHSLLIKDLGVGRNIRIRRMGISGTNYAPLDNDFRIREALDATCRLLNGEREVFARALLALVLLSYIQPFEDGNKRTPRIVANAILMSEKHCPLSFRTVDPIEYKKAMLLFYEQNNLAAFKKIFIQQVEFAVETYF